MHQSPGEGTEIATQRGMVEGLHSERYDWEKSRELQP